MAEKLDMRKAEEVYKTLIRMLDGIDWNYDRDDDKLLIKSGVKGDDFPVEFIVVVQPKQEVVQFLSTLPFKMPEDKRIDGAVATSVVNYRLVHGSFDYDMRDGRIIFRMTSSYRDSKISEELLEYTIMVSAATVDDYNDKLFMLSKGMITLDDFIKKVEAD